MESQTDTVTVMHSENSFNWADGGNGKGRNMLGQILMDTREN